MATGYHFSTNADGKLQAQHVVDDVANRTDIIPFGCWVQNVDGTNITISNGGSVMMSFPASAVLTVEEAAAEEDINDLVIQLGAVFPDASSGGGGVNFTVMSGTVLEGEQYKASTANLVFTATTGSGILHHKNGASWTLEVNGTDIPTRTSAVNGGNTAHAWYYNAANGKVYVEDKDGLEVETTPAAPDVTAPTATYEAIDAHTIVETFDEDTTGDGVGIAFSNGSPLTINSATRNSATEIEYDIDEAMTDADTIVFERSASDIEDLAGNPLADDTGSVTNSIAGGTLATADRVSLYTPTTMDTATTPGRVVLWADKDGDVNKDFEPIVGVTTPNDTSGGIGFTGSQNLGVDATYTLSAAPAGPGFTMYYELEVTAAGGLGQSSGNSLGYGIYFVDASNMFVAFNGGAASCAFGIPFNTRGTLAVTFINGVPAKFYWNGSLLGSANLASGTGHIVYELAGAAGNRFEGIIWRYCTYSVVHDASTVSTQTPLLEAEA